MSLTTEKVKWILPPGVRGSAEAISDSGEENEDSDSDEDFDNSSDEDERSARGRYGGQRSSRRCQRRGRSGQRRQHWRSARRRSPSDPLVRI